MCVPAAAATSGSSRPCRSWEDTDIVQYGMRLRDPDDLSLVLARHPLLGAMAWIDGARLACVEEAWVQNRGISRSRRGECCRHGNGRPQRMTLDRPPDSGAPESPPRGRVTAPDAAPMDPAIFIAILQTNWENVRSIKSERISFLNTFSLIAAGTQSLLFGIRGSPIFRLAVNLLMGVFAVMGLVISLRLKAELEECLEKIHAMVAKVHAEEFMALERSEGDLARYPKFRWMFPLFYCVAIVFFAALAVQGLTFTTTEP